MDPVSEFGGADAYARYGDAALATGRRRGKCGRSERAYSVSRYTIGAGIVAL